MIKNEKYNVIYLCNKCNRFIHKEIRHVMDIIYPMFIDSFAFASTSDDTATTTDYSETLEHLDLRFRKLAVYWSSSSDNVDIDKINASKYQG